MIYDIAVIGLGGMGSAVLHHAARTGANAIGIEQFPLVHDRGSSHGHTRIIRQAYFEHPDYVPLLLEAYDLWSELEQQFGQQLYYETGLVQSGPAAGVIVPGVLRSAQAYELPIDHLSAAEARERFPMFRFSDDHEVAFEHRAGYLLVERCVAAHLHCAQQSGARIVAQCAVGSLERDGDPIVIHTDQGNFSARRVVLTPGAWLPHWLQVDAPQLKPLRKHLHWFSTTDVRAQQSAGCPLFFFEELDGYYYGFPAIDQRGIKVAEHSGGESVTDPHALDRSIDPVDLARVEAFTRKTFYGSLNHSDHATCMYTMTVDHHFVIDRYPSDDRVWIAGGFSGHGFKFASVVGKLVAAACLTNQADPRITFLGLNRFRTQPDA